MEDVSDTLRTFYRKSRTSRVQRALKRYNTHTGFSWGEKYAKHV